MNIDIDGYNIKVKITGAGEETCVMLQGWGTTLEVYDSVADALNDRYRFIQFDLPGFGGSDEPREPWNVDAYSLSFSMYSSRLSIERWSGVFLFPIPCTNRMPSSSLSLYSFFLKRLMVRNDI